MKKCQWCQSESHDLNRMWQVPCDLSVSLRPKDAHTWILLSKTPLNDSYHKFCKTQRAFFPWLVNHIVEHIFKLLGMVKWFLYYNSQKYLLKSPIDVHATQVAAVCCKGHPAVCHENRDQCSCLQTIQQDFQFLNEQNLLSEFGSFPLPSAFKQNLTLKLFEKGKKNNFTHFFPHFLLKFLAIYFCSDVFSFWDSSSFPKAIFYWWKRNYNLLVSRQNCRQCKALKSWFI